MSLFKFESKGVLDVKLFRGWFEQDEERNLLAPKDVWKTRAMVIRRRMVEDTFEEDILVFILSVGWMIIMLIMSLFIEKTYA